MRTVALVLGVWGLSAWAQEPSGARPRLVSAVVIGAAGIGLAGAYTVGAVLTGDGPGGWPLGIVGGVVSWGLLGAGLGLGINARRAEPNTLLGFVLVPLLGGLGGALLGGLLGALGAHEPGTARTATHGVVVGLLLTETVLAELWR